MATPSANQEFFLVIHGETDAHVQELVCGGGWDPPLNAEGLKQAKKLSKDLAKSKPKIKTIFSSPLLRCIQTTDILHDVLKVKVRVISGLSERNLGQWEKNPVAKISGFSPLAEQVPGGESLNRFRARVQESINYVLDSSISAGGPSLMVSHGIFGVTLLGLLSIPAQDVERCVLYRLTRESPSTPWKIEEV